ncbi:DUF6471 domain-containing protein [Paraburkholderia sp. GAS42]|uniref:DUF6471 domain-containing protein n=1 Tax=Paraburkholderia sp. GAS42 TaxID=3035135 RepID=UPI003D1AE325
MSANDALEGVDFDYECRKMLKDELHRHGLTYRGLAELLQGAGMDETEKSIAHKALRGTFRMSFFLQVLRVLGTTKLVVQVPMSKNDIERSVTSFHEA